MIKATSLRAFEETFRVAQQKTAALSKQALIDTAEDVRDEVIARQRSRAGVSPDYDQVVDRIRDAPLSSVRPDGVIMFEWIYLQEVARVGFEMLVARGPQLSGAWNKSIAVFVDDVRASIAAITPATRLIEIAPVIIYARRLEIGKRKGGQPFILKAPPHLVEETAIFLRRTYAGVATVKHSFVQIQGNTGSLRGKARNRANAEMRYPAIQIRPLAA